MTITLLIIASVVIAVIYVASNLLAGFSKVAKTESQVVFINEYLNYAASESTKWIHNCSSKEDVIYQGQEKLWKHVDIFHDNMQKLSNNGFKLVPEDDIIMKQALAIVGTVHLMHAAENGRIVFQKKEDNGE